MILNFADDSPSTPSMSPDARADAPASDLWNAAGSLAPGALTLATQAQDAAATVAAVAAPWVPSLVNQPALTPQPGASVPAPTKSNASGILVAAAALGLLLVWRKS